ncbi:MAG TPA: serine/threonine-protein kinase, partial [Thermoanaerobaculia bacterium]|nr:serine/threonine-protein kinase [Thermoanaerobaculia bacterium]
MTPERWQRLKTLFAGALAESAGEGRPPSVPEGVDPELAAELKVLLDEHARTGGFLEEPADALLFSERRHVGPYVLLKEIGRGGMGTVFLARREDGVFDRTVALKAVRRGLDTDDILARFKDERQILAGLQHPNIATLYDGGSTDDGRPYFAMEHVEGERIDRYCVLRSLPLEKRLALFFEVCRAVQYAHERHVVHRDLKPENILVTAEGAPKLLDFGIAKVLEPAAGEPSGGTNFTRATQGILTPAYASPEQLRRMPTTFATDVYSLGLLLFLLVTDRHPFDDGRRSAEEVRQAMVDLEAPRPSAVVPSVSRDVDAVVLRALEREPEDRYASVADLGSDVSRLIDGLSPAARPRGRLRGVRRLAARHPAGMALLAAAAVAAAAGVTFLRRSAVVTAPQSAVPARRSIAVLGFRNVTGEPRSAWLSRAFSEMLTTEMAAGGHLRTVPGEAVARMKADLSL